MFYTGNEHRKVLTAGVLAKFPLFLPHGISMYKATPK